MFIQAKYKEKAASCMSGVCLHLGAIANGRIGDVPSRRKSRTASASHVQPRQCPTVDLFPALADSSPVDGHSLEEQLEQSIRNGLAAIGQLEQFRAHGDVLRQIREAFEEQKSGEEEDEEGDWEEEEATEEGEEEESSTNFADKFVRLLKGQYELARQIEQLVPALFDELSSGALQTEEKLSSERFLSKNFAKLLEMAIRFDALKAATPELQNGFSLFRRMNLLKHFGKPLLHAHLGDQIALFLSRPTPMLTSLVNGAERFIGRQSRRELAISHLTEALLVIYNVLKHTLERRKQLKLGEGGECPVSDFLLRAMAGLLLLFDHVELSPGGVFCSSNSPFDIAQFAALVRSSTSVEKADQHLTALRFMSRHFNDSKTPMRLLFN